MVEGEDAQMLFETSWPVYLNSIRMLAERRLNTKKPPLPKEKTLALLDDVIRELKSKRAIGEITDVSRQMRQHPDDRQILEFFAKELELFNEVVAEDESSEGNDGTDPGQRLSQAGILKDSLEALFKKKIKPDSWLGKLLTILNELLKLLRST